MAEKKAGGLYMRIGLTLSRLQSDFLAAEQTVKQGIAALNRQQNIVRLRMEADTAGLDAVADKTKILEIQERSLTQILDMQRDKLRLASAAYQDVVKSKGENSTVAKQLEASVERERLAVARLEAQLKSLSAQKITFDAAKLQDSVSKLNAKIQNIRLKAEIDTSKLKSAGEVFDAQKVHVAALTRELELQRQKLVELQAQMYKSAQQNGANSATTLNFKSNVLRQIQEINQLQAKLREVQNTNINVQIRADSLRRVEAEITEKISLLNSKLEHIRVKTDIDVSKLGSAASEFDKARAHVQGLNRELDLQNQKLAQMRQALGASVSTNGLNNVKTINLQTEIQKQIQAIDQLKAKINELNKIQPPKNNGLLNGYLNIKGDIAGKLNSITSAFANLKGATSSADSAVTSVLTVIGEIPHPVGRAVAALAGLPLIFKGIENSIIEMTRAAAVSGDAVYVMSRGMQMSVKDAGKFSTNAKVAGTDVNSLRIAVQNVQRQIVKGGDDSRAAEWLKRYGESARDASGNIKNLNDMTTSLSRALHKAQAEGKGSEFVFNVFRNISPDDITAIEDWIAVNEQASKIVKNGLANPALAHEVKGNLNALAVQEGQLKASFESALLPVANEIIPRITERAGKLTQILADNKDVIKEIGKDLASIWGGIESVVDTIGSGIGKVGSVFKAIYMARAKAEDRLVARYKNDTDVKTAEDLLKKELARSYTPQDRAAIEATPYRYEQELKKYEPIVKAIQDSREKIAEEKKSLAAEMAGKVAGGFLAPLVGTFDQDITPALQRYRDEVEAINYKLSHTDYENSIFDINQKYDKLLRDGEKSALEQIEIEKLRIAELNKLEQERADKLQEIRDSVAAADRTALQNKLANIEKERQAWIKAGMDEAEAAQLAEQKRLKAIQEAHEKANQYIKNAADIEYGLTHTAFEKQIRDIEQWKDLMRQKAETEEEAAAVGAAAKEAEAFEAAMDRIRSKLQSLDDKIFAQEHSQYEQDMRRAQQERLRYYEDFQKEGMLNADTQARIERWYANEVSNLQKKFAEAQKSSSDYIKSPSGTMQRGGNGINVIGADQIIDDGKIKQSIGLLADENEIRRQYLATLPQKTRERINAIDATRKLASAQNDLARQTKQTADNISVIRGDQVTHLSHEDAAKIADLQRGQEQAFQQLQQTLELQPQQPQPEQLPQPPTQQPIAEAQKNFVDSAKNFPPDYFRQLAEGTKAVSETQGSLIDSTLKLIDAQNKFAAALSNQPTRETSTTTPDNGMMKLTATTDDLRDAQGRLVQSTRDADARFRAVSDIPPNAPTVKKDDGFFSNPKAKFDMDTFSGIAQTGLEAVALLRMLGTLAPHPALKAAAGVLGLAVGAGAGVGMYGHKLDENEQPQISDDKLKPYVEADLSKLITPVVNIDGNVQNILAALKPESADIQDTSQESHIDEHLTELLGALPNIEADVRDILAAIQLPQEEVDTSAHPADAAPIDYLTPLNAINANVQGILTAIQPQETADTSARPTQETIDYLTPLANIDAKIQSVLDTMQIQQETPVTFDTIVTPLNNISTIVANILTALGNRKPTQINVSPNNNINLGGAYVFDNEMKKALVEDCTSQIVDNITAAVQQAISRSNYNYGA